MALKVEGGSSAIYKKPFTVRKPTVNPTDTDFNPKPETNASVYADRNKKTQHANLFRFNQNAQFKPTAAESTPTINSAEAAAIADEIIVTGGGRENLNAVGVGSHLAAIAVRNPSDAWAVTLALFGERVEQFDEGEIRENDKEDIAQQFTAALKNSEISMLARDNAGRNLLDRMQRYLLSGNVHEDEHAAAGRIQAEIGKFRIFSEWYQGVDPNSVLAYTVSYETAFDTAASPEKAAAGLKTNNRISYDVSSDTRAFTDQLEAHRTDAEWLERYFSALGSDKTAELLCDSATPSAYSDYLYGSMTGSEEAAVQYQQNMRTLRRAFDTIAGGGKFSRTDTVNLIASMTDYNFNPSIAIDVFGGASEAVREFFVRAAIELGGDALEAAGGYVLSQMSVSSQSRVLGGLSSHRLNGFLHGAMTGQTETLDMRYYLATGMGDRSITLGGVRRILETVNRTVVYNDARTAAVPELSPELQNRIFCAVACALSDPRAFGNFSVDRVFKDELSRLFMRNAADILRAQAPDGKFVDADFIGGLTDFFSLTLFSDNGGELRDELMQFVTCLLNVGDGGAKNDPPLSQNEYERLFNGWSQKDHEQVMAELCGMIEKAASKSNICESEVEIGKKVPPEYL